jgi:hypothetical protein
MGSLKGRVAGTFVVIWCWLIFAILFLAFYPTGFDIWQNFAFFIVSALVAGGIVVLIWIKMIPL